MTSDAKIGLLLGLVFIFVIAFIINGVPSFRKDRNNNELTTNMVGSQNNPPGLAAKERKACREVINQMRLAQKQPPGVQTPSKENQNVRFETALPGSRSVVKETVEIKRAPPAPLPMAIIAEKSRAKKKVKSVKPALPKVYVVGEGDNLALVAKKFYGDQEGNRRINVNRIFQANRKVLKSPDEVYVGDKLIIPSLSASVPGKDKIGSSFSATMFKKVESIGRRYLSTNKGRVKQSGAYIVRQGDSLWQIAAEQLGDGNRYREIVKLNTDIIECEDSLAFGMNLKIPVR